MAWRTARFVLGHLRVGWGKTEICGFGLLTGGDAYVSEFACGVGRWDADLLAVRGGTEMKVEGRAKWTG